VWEGVESHFNADLSYHGLKAVSCKWWWWKLSRESRNEVAEGSIFQNWWFQVEREVYESKSHDDMGLNINEDLCNIL
jgi:hypothetical protein